MNPNKITNCYFNLTKKCISYFQSGDKVRHCDSIQLEDVQFYLREGSQDNPARGTRQWTLKNQRKCVHAFVKGKCMSQWAIAHHSEVMQAEFSEPGAIFISYNPYKAGYFYDRTTGKAVASAKICTVSTQGIFAWGVEYA